MTGLWQHQSDKLGVLTCFFINREIEEVKSGLSEGERVRVTQGRGEVILCIKI